MEFFYYEQLRNYRLQFQRAFSEFYVEYGPDKNGDKSLSKVPCRYGDPTRIAEVAINNNSENKIPPVPFITYHIQSLNMTPERRQDPYFVGKYHTNERLYNEETNKYLQAVGNRYTIERFMPVPFDMIIALDIWTNNLQIKDQILEQILCLFNPSIVIQTSNNAFDWTSISLIEQTEIAWSSRSIPIGTDNPIDVTTITYKIPIWINPPAKVKEQVLIQEIITNIIHGIKEYPEQWGWSEFEEYGKRYTTPGNYHIRIKQNGANYNVSLNTSAGTPISPTVVPTINITANNPELISGDSFMFNDILITIGQDISLKGIVNTIRTAFVNTSYNCDTYNETYIRFINQSGGNNTYSNVTGSPLTSMGLLPITYPGGWLSWQMLFDKLGILKPYALFGKTKASELRIVRNQNNPELDIIGWIDLDPTNQNGLIWTLNEETLPPVTLPPVDAVIDPVKSGPGINLPNAATGQRYLLLESPAQTSEAWGNMENIFPNDIIQFDGAKWYVVFNGSDSIQYVVNNYNGKLLVWDDIHWEEFIQKSYRQGQWRLSL